MKDEILKEFEEIRNEYYKNTGKDSISRDYYLKKSKFGYKFQKYFLFNEMKELTKLNIKEQKFKSKKYIISSIVPRAKNNDKFINAMLRYCMINNANLLLVPIKGVNKEVLFTDDVINQYGKYFIGDFTFNSNLKLINTNITANNNPINRLKKIVHKDYSFIIPSTRQKMEIIPSMKTNKVHLLYSTGTVSIPDYNSNITGFINKENNKLGALIVEVKNDKLFNIRNVNWINNHFIDLNKAYYFDKVIDKNAEAIIAGDLHIGGDESEIALKALKEQIKLLKPNYLFIHDLASHNSINHHSSHNFISMNKLNSNCKTLEDEHKYIANWLNNYTKDIKNVELIIVASNHNEWLNKYLGRRNTWINDNFNVKYANYLVSLALEGLNPFEIAIRRLLRKDIKIKFLTRKDSFKIANYELACHGDIGNGGAQGTLSSLEQSLGKCIIGHSHTPKIGDVGFQVGTNSKLDLNYTSGSGNSWVHANCSIFNSGHVQMIMSFDGKWN